ncbi:NAD(P)-binding protein, partial [Paraphaeosphaeria sporulosa]
MSWQPPSDYATRPVTILGAGVLGRRIACTWAAAGYNVHIRDPSAAQLTQCASYFESNIGTYKQKTSSSTTGTISTFADLEPAVATAWLIVEAVPEVLDLKTKTFTALEAHAPRDALLATNSSSYKSSEMLSGLVSPTTASRILNTHYYMPPANMVVELMTCGHTHAPIFPFLAARLRETGAAPYTARVESTGFIFNRLWAAVKRETLAILSEGVSTPEEIDALWTDMFVRGQATPCRLMDQVGLDTVAFIEAHYVAERGLDDEHTVRYLEREFIAKGRLGDKSGKGGLYPP